MASNEDINKQLNPKKTMKKVINVNQYAYEQEKNQLEVQKNDLQEIVNTLSQNGINDLTTADIMPLCNDPEGFIIECLTKDVPSTFAGLPIKKASLFEIAEIPAFVEPLLKYANEDYRRIKISGYAEYLEIKNNKVLLSKDALENLKERYTHFAEGKSQCEGFDIYQGIADALNKVSDLTSQSFLGDRIDALNDRLDFQNGKFIVKENFIHQNYSNK